MEKFWQIEEATIHEKPQSVEETAHVEHFIENISVANRGKFLVKLPFKIERSMIAYNWSRASVTLFRVEKILR